MATTVPNNQPRPASPQPVRVETHNNYGAAWAILALIVLAAVAYGFYSANRTDTMATTTPMVQSTPAPASTVSPNNEPATAPGTPDTTATESTTAPATTGTQY